MTRKWIERQIDEALLAIAMGTGFLYLRRRARRVLREVAVGGAVAAGLAGLVAVAVAAAATLRYRSRAKRSAALAPASATPDWHPPEAGREPMPTVGANSGRTP